MPVVFSVFTTAHPIGDCQRRRGRRSSGQPGGRFIAVGGSSVVDCAKGIAVLLATGHSHIDELRPVSFGPPGDPFEATKGSPFPLLMVTTTLSFAEFLPFWGVRTAVGSKVAYPDYGRVMRTVFLYGAVAVHTPDSVWAETGVKALDDAISAFCRSADPEPFIHPILIRGHRRPGGATAGFERSRCCPCPTGRITSTWMTKSPLPRLGPVTTTGWFRWRPATLSAGCCVPHGVGSCVSLIEGLRFHQATTGGARRRWLRLSAGVSETLTGPLSDPAWRSCSSPLACRPGRGECGIGPRPSLVAEHMLAEPPQLGSLESIRGGLPVDL